MVIYHGTIRKKSPKQQIQVEILSSNWIEFPQLFGVTIPKKIHLKPPRHFPQLVIPAQWKPSWITKKSKGRSEAPVKTRVFQDSPWQHSQWTSPILPRPRFPPCSPKGWTFVPPSPRWTREIWLRCSHAHSLGSNVEAKVPKVSHETLDIFFNQPKSGPKNTQIFSLCVFL